MSNQEKIAYLKQYKTLDKHINRLLEEKEMWFTRATKVTQTIDDMPRGGDGEDARQKAIANMMDADMRANQAIDEYTDLGKEIKAVIKSIGDSTLELLLEYRYIDGKTFERIAVDMNYSWKQTHRLHNEALTKIMS